MTAGVSPSTHASFLPFPRGAMPRSGIGLLRTEFGGIGGASTTSHGPTANATRYVGRGFVVASPEGRIRNSSVSSLLADLKVAAEVGLDAVCFHVGYAKGHPSADAALTLATRKLGELIGRMPAGPRLLIENSCEGSELGQTIDELARLVPPASRTRRNLALTPRR